MNYYGESDLISCLRKSSHERLPQELDIIFRFLHGLEALRSLRESSLRAICRHVRYEHHEANTILYCAGEMNTCWYILMAGSVFIDNSMYLPRSWTDLDISGIEPLEMSVAANDPAHDSTFEMEAPADPGPADTKLTHQNKCQECGKVFPRKQSLKRHRSMHDSRLRHHCEICGKGYCERFRVARHVEEKHTSKRVMCDICGKQFINKASLQVHIDAHNDKYRYRCRVCNKGFTHKSYLEPHMEVHGKPVPRHKCPTCGKEFKTKPGLGSHVNHCGKEGAEFKFHCKICVKGFKEKRYLREHEKRHENPNSFRCDVCGQNYGYSASLYKHKKNAH